MANKSYKQNGDWIIKELNTGTKPNTPAVVDPYMPARCLILSVDDGEVATGGSATEKISITTVDGLEVARGTDPADATLLDYDGDVTLMVDGSELTKTLSNGSVSFDLTTEKPAGSTIEIVAESLADHPAESDRAEIEVTQ